jgi:uncharacterized protein
MLRYFKISLFALALLLPSSTTIVPAQAQSINCRLAEKPDEVIICQSSRLSELDPRLANLYVRMRDSLAVSERAAFVANQVRWLQSRMNCKQDARCIEEHYQRRIPELSGPRKVNPRRKV